VEGAARGGVLDQCSVCPAERCHTAPVHVHETVGVHESRLVASSATAQFDVVLSCSGRDRELVEQIAGRGSSSARAAIYWGSE